MKIVAISGKQGSGKTTLSSGLYDWYKDKREVLRFKFADPLYGMQAALKDVLHYYGETFKTPDGKLLQLLGTEWGRETLGEDVWARILERRIKGLYEADHDKKLVIVDDCRFVNELKLFEDLKYWQTGIRVVTVRLEAPEHVRKVRAEKWRDNTNHRSEVALDESKGQFELVLDGHNLSAPEIVDRVCFALNQK